MTENDLRGWYLRYAETVNRHELGGMEEFFNDEVVLNGTAGTRDDVVTGLRDVFDAIPDFRWEFKQVLVDGNRIMIHATNSGTPVKEWLGVPATGESFEIDELVIYTVGDGRFVEIVKLHDSDALRQQLAV